MSISEHKHMPEPVRRIEVFTGAGRRRNWSREEKAAIIAESYGAGETVCRVARRHGLTPPQLFTWHRLARRSALELPPMFVPAVVETTEPELGQRMLRRRPLIGRPTLEPGEVDARQTAGDRVTSPHFLKPDGRNRRNLAVPTRRGEGPESAPTRPIHGGASGNAPGSGTAELTKLEIRPDLDNDEIAGWRRRGHRDADARRGARILSRSLGATAPPRHGAFHSTWNECRRHLGLAGHTYRLRICTSA